MNLVGIFIAALCVAGLVRGPKGNVKLLALLAGLAVAAAIGAKLWSATERGGFAWHALDWELTAGYRYPGAMVAVLVALPVLHRVFKPQAGMALPVLAASAVASIGWNAVHVASLGRFGDFGWVGAGLSFGNNAIQFTNFPFGRKGALTLGNVQIYRNARPGKSDFWYGVYQNTGLHEQAHTYQSQVLGPLFLPAYLLSGNPISGSNPFERAATDFATGAGGWWP